MPSVSAYAASGSPGSETDRTTTVTVPATGVNQLILAVGIAVSMDTTAPGMTAKWAGIAMSTAMNIGQDDNGYYYMFYYPGPAHGSGNCVIHATRSSRMAVVVYVIDDVNQSAPVHYVLYDGTAGSLSGIPSIYGDLVIDLVGCRTFAPTIPSGIGTDQVAFVQYVLSGAAELPANLGSSAKLAPATAAISGTTMSWSGGLDNDIFHAAVAISPTDTTSPFLGPMME